MNIWPIAELVPHAGDMILVDEVLRNHHPFADSCRWLIQSGRRQHARLGRH